jgi:hypothetical protein
VSTWVRNARSKNHGFIFCRYMRVFSLMVKKRMTTRTTRENPTEMNNHFRCDLSMSVGPQKKPARDYQVFLEVIVHSINAFTPCTAGGTGRKLSK